jgi:3-oxoadipate enol-lactonase
MPFLNLDEITVNYRDEGAGPQTMIFVHALGTDLRIWDAVVAETSRRFRCIRYDLRGHGQSSVTSGALSMGQLATDLVRVMDALGIARATLCGISIGGLVAQHVAIHEPERVAGLVLCGTALKIGTAAAWEDRIRLVESRGLPNVADDIMARWFKAGFRDRQPEAYADLRGRFVAMSSAGYVAACHALRDTDFTGLADRIDAPTLVLCGAEDVAAPPEAARLLCSAIEGAHLSVIADAGHLPCVETPDQVARAIDGFLTEASLV